MGLVGLPSAKIALGRHVGLLGGPLGGALGHGVPETAVEPEKLKDITEPNGTFVCRPLYGEAMYIHPTFKIGIMSNHMLNLGEKPDSL